MNVESFNNLELIPELVKQVGLMVERMVKLAPPLTSKREVAKFLNKSERTINNYIGQGLLRENYHFYRKNGKILVFIEDAILEFRDERDKGIVG